MVVWLADWSVVVLIGWRAILLFDLLHGLLYWWFTGKNIWLHDWQADFCIDGLLVGCKTDSMVIKLAA